MLWVFENGSCKLIHFLNGLATKLWLPNVIDFLKFIPVDKDDFVFTKPKLILEKVNGDFSGWFSGFISFIDCVDQYLVSNQIVFSL